MSSINKELFFIHNLLFNGVYNHIVDKSLYKDYKLKV